jgi:hypothetical protein
VASNQPSPVTLLFQSIHQLPDVAEQMLPVFFSTHLIHAVGGVLSDPLPATVQHRPIDHPIQIAKPVLLLASRLLRYSQQ